MIRAKCYVWLAIMSSVALRGESSGPREPPPQSLTQPDVNLSVHPAPIDLPIVVPVASAQTGKPSVSQCAQANKRLCVCNGVTFCTSAWPIVAMRR